MPTSKPFQEPIISDPIRTTIVPTLESDNSTSSADISEYTPRDCPSECPTKCPLVLQPIFDAHDLVADLYDQIPPENKWKRLAMRKALLNPNLRKAEDAVSQQCRIALDHKRPTQERELAERRIAEGMQYWKQLILGRN